MAVQMSQRAKPQANIPSLTPLRSAPLPQPSSAFGSALRFKPAPVIENAGTPIVKPTSHVPKEDVVQLHQRLSACQDELLEAMNEMMSLERSDSRFASLEAQM